MNYPVYTITFKIKFSSKNKTRFSQIHEVKLYK